MEKRLLLSLFICCILAANLEEYEAAKARHYKFEVAYIYWSPDCEERMMIGINGRFPGPTIRAKAGDTIVVELKNSLPTEGVVIHWHGIKQVCFYGHISSLNNSPLFSCSLCQCSEEFAGTSVAPPLSPQTAAALRPSPLPLRRSRQRDLERSE